jgi:hypothetical protein
LWRLRHNTASARISISDEAFDLARQVVDAIGSGAVDHPIEVGAPAHCQKWINEGWNPQFCLIVVRQVMNRRGHDNPPNTLKFFDKAISEYHAEMHRPLPKTNIKAQETINVADSKVSRKQNLLGTEIVNGQRRLNELAVTIGHFQFFEDCAP